MKRSRPTLLAIGIACAFVVGIGLWNLAEAQDAPAPAAAAENDAELRVGTLEPGMAFQHWAGRDEAIAQMQQIQTQAQAAQQAGDEMQVMQLQNQMQQKQQELLTNFERDLREVLPEVAREAGVKVIAVNIAYTADDVETQDLTAEVVEALGGDAAMLDQPMLPGGFGQ
jgi:TolA-binding protein